MGQVTGEGNDGMLNQSLAGQRDDGGPPRPLGDGLDDAPRGFQVGWIQAGALLGRCRFSSEIFGCRILLPADVS